MKEKNIQEVLTKVVYGDVREIPLNRIIPYVGDINWEELDKEQTLRVSIAATLLDMFQRF